MCRCVSDVFRRFGVVLGYGLQVEIMVDIDEVWERVETILDNSSARLIFRLEWLIFTGTLLFILPMYNLIYHTSWSWGDAIPGDFFWSLAGACLLLESIIELRRLFKITGPLEDSLNEDE